MKIIQVFILSLICSIFINASEITISTGLSIPPYVIKQNNSGIQIDIVKEVLKSKGHNIKNIIYASNKRVLKLLTQKEVDMVINIQPNVKKIYYSDVILNFDNVAISLKRKNLQIKTINDLLGKNVLGFQNANKFLGKEFSDYTKKSKNYNEVINQVAQVKQLFEKWTDVVISDKKVFLYFRNLHKDKFDPNIELDFFPILKPSPRRAGFLSQELRDDFNEGLKQLKKSNKFNQILQKYNYIKPMGK